MCDCQDIESMQKYAYAVSLLNGPNSVTEIYVQKNPIFYQFEHQKSTIQDAAAHDGLVAFADDFFAKVKHELASQMHLLPQIFTMNASKVLRVFFERTVQEIASVWELCISWCSTRNLIDCTAR